MLSLRTGLMCWFVLCSQGGSSSNHFPWFKRFWNDRDRADMVACGAAAGARQPQQNAKQCDAQQELMYAASAPLWIVSNHAVDSGA
jgi:hypothetical protein